MLEKVFYRFRSSYSTFDHEGGVISAPSVPQSQEAYEAYAHDITRDNANERFQRIGNMVVDDQTRSSIPRHIRLLDPSNSSLGVFFDNVAEIGRYKDSYVKAVKREVSNTLGNDDSGNNRLVQHLSTEVGDFSDMEAELLTQTLDNTINAVLYERDISAETSLAALEHVETTLGAVISEWKHLSSERIQARKERLQSKVTIFQRITRLPGFNSYQLDVKQKDIFEGLDFAYDNISNKIQQAKIEKRLQIDFIRDRIAEQFRRSRNAATQIEDPTGRTNTSAALTNFLNTISLHPARFIDGTIAAEFSPGGLAIYKNWQQVFRTQRHVDLLDALRKHGFDDVDGNHPANSYLEGAVATRETETFSDRDREMKRRHEHRHDTFHENLGKDDYFTKFEAKFEKGSCPIDASKKKVALPRLVKLFDKKFQSVDYQLNDVYEQVAEINDLTPQEKICYIVRFLAKVGPQNLDVPQDIMAMVIRWFRDTHSKGGERLVDGTIDDPGEYGNRAFFERCHDTYKNTSIAVEFFSDISSFRHEVQLRNSPKMAALFGILEQLDSDYETYFKGDHPHSFKHAKSRLKAEEYNRLKEHWLLIEQVVLKMRQKGNTSEGAKNKTYVDQLKSVPERIALMKQRQKLWVAMEDIVTNGKGSKFDTGQYPAMQAQADAIDKKIEDDGGDVYPSNIPVPRFNFSRKIGNMDVWTGGGYGAGGLNDAYLVNELISRDPKKIDPDARNIDAIMYRELAPDFNHGILRRYRRQRNKTLGESLENLKKVNEGTPFHGEYQIVAPNDKSGPRLGKVRKNALEDFTIMWKDGSNFLLKGKMVLPDALNKRSVEEERLKEKIAAENKFEAKAHREYDDILGRCDAIPLEKNKIEDEITELENINIYFVEDPDKHFAKIRKLKESLKNLEKEFQQHQVELNDINKGLDKNKAVREKLENQLDHIKEVPLPKTDVVVMLGNAIKGHPSGGSVGKMAVYRADHFDKRMIGPDLDWRRFRAYKDKPDHYGLLMNFTAGENKPAWMKEEYGDDHNPWQKNEIKDEDQKLKDYDKEEERKALQDRGKTGKIFKADPTEPEPEKPDKDKDPEGDEPEGAEGDGDIKDIDGAIEILEDPDALTPENKAKLLIFFEKAEQRKDFLEHIHGIFEQKDIDPNVLISTMITLFQAVYELGMDDFFKDTGYSADDFANILDKLELDPDSNAHQFKEALMDVLTDPSDKNKQTFRELIAGLGSGGGGTGTPPKGDGPPPAGPGGETPPGGSVPPETPGPGENPPGKPDSDIEDGPSASTTEAEKIFREAVLAIAENAAPQVHIHGGAEVTGDIILNRDGTVERIGDSANASRHAQSTIGQSVSESHEEEEPEPNPGPGPEDDPEEDDPEKESADWKAVLAILEQQAGSLDKLATTINQWKTQDQEKFRALVEHTDKIFAQLTERLESIHSKKDQEALIRIMRTLNESSVQVSALLGQNIELMTKMLETFEKLNGLSLIGQLQRLIEDLLESGAISVQFQELIAIIVEKISVTLNKGISTKLAELLGQKGFVLEINGVKINEQLNANQGDVIMADQVVINNGTQSPQPQSKDDSEAPADDPHFSSSKPK